jgi:hypothetical protein
VQFGEPAAKLTTTGAAPFTEIAADCVLAETYAGRRFDAAGTVEAGGIVITSFTLDVPAGGAVVGDGVATPLPPPLQAESATHNTKPNHSREDICQILILSLVCVVGLKSQGPPT